MPYKSEKIKLKGLQDRRRKLTDDQKLEIKDKYSTGLYSLNNLAKEYGVSKKLILLTVNPDSADNARKYSQEHWRDYQPSKEDRAKFTREHRRYKHQLYLRGELIDNETTEETENNK